MDRNETPNKASLVLLPRELRDIIYNSYFQSLRLSHGRRICPPGLSIQARRLQILTPRHHSLALLRTCRQIAREIGTSWLQHVLFHFENPDDMLATLMSQARCTISQIRYIRVGSKPFYTCTDRVNGGQGIFLVWRLPQTLALLPALRLHTLTVLCSEKAYYSYQTLDELIRFSDCFDKLHFLTPTAKLLGSTISQARDVNGHWWERPRPELQPYGWRRFLNANIPGQAKPSVHMFCNKSPRKSLAVDWDATVINPANRLGFAQIPAGMEVSKRKKLTFLDREKLSDYQMEQLVVVQRSRGGSSQNDLDDRGVVRPAQAHAPAALNVQADSAVGHMLDEDANNDADDEGEPETLPPVHALSTTTAFLGDLWRQFGQNMYTQNHDALPERRYPRANPHESIDWRAWEDASFAIVEDVYHDPQEYAWPWRAHYHSRLDYDGHHDTNGPNGLNGPTADEVLTWTGLQPQEEAARRHDHAEAGRRATQLHEAMIRATAGMVAGRLRDAAARLWEQRAGMEVEAEQLSRRAERLQAQTNWQLDVLLDMDPELEQELFRLFN